VTEQREALTAAGASSLQPKVIDRYLQDQVRRMSPLLHELPDEKWSTGTFFWNKRTVMPNGGNVVDGGARAMSSSTYAQSSVNLALFQALGGVTGFAESVTAAQVGSLRAIEEDATIESHQWDLENEICWGNAAATATASGQYPQHDGLDSIVNSFSGSAQNAFDQSDASATLAMLDKLLTTVSQRVAAPLQGAGERWFFVMSQGMKVFLESLLTNQQRFLDVQAPAGLLVPSYKGIPILESSFLAPLGNQMGAVSLSTSTTGGTLAAATYYYQIGAVMARFGEIAACAEVSQATSGTTSTVSATFTTPAGPDAAGPLLYKVYRATSSGAETLLGIVDAFDTTAVATTTIIDTGTNLQTNSAGNTGPAAYVGTSGQKPRGLLDEDIYILPQDRNYILRPYIRDMEVVDLARTSTAPDVLPFAVFSEQALAVRSSKYVARIARAKAA
jgi:hypothetical protein